MTTPDQSHPVQVPVVGPAEAAELADGGAILLDVRESGEWASGHITGATHMPLGQLAPDNIPANRVVVTVCRSGKRSGKAAAQLAAAGIDVRNLDGGMTAWAAAGRPVRTVDGSEGTVA